MPHLFNVQSCMIGTVFVQVQLRSIRHIWCIRTSVVHAQRVVRADIENTVGILWTMKLTSKC